MTGTYLAERGGMTSLYDTLRATWERTTIMTYLHRHRGNVTQAAAELGISRRWIEKVLAREGIQDEARALRTGANDSSHDANNASHLGSPRRERASAEKGAKAARIGANETSHTKKRRSQKSAQRHTLNLDSLRRGLGIFAEKYPHHFADMMNEDGDMTTGDVFVQCCLFGDVKYQ